MFQVRLLPVLLLLRGPAAAQGQEDQGGARLHRGLQGAAAREAQGELQPPGRLIITQPHVHSCGTHWYEQRSD